jgi:ABC-type multidrug transport system fused ATPase/permease subunit
MKLKSKSLILECYKILTLAERKKYNWITVTSILVTLLDLVGIFLIGLLTVITLGAIQQQGISSSVNLFLEISQLNNYSVQIQVAFLGILAAVVLISRTLFSMFLSKKMITFLANQCTEVSKTILNGFFYKSISFMNGRSQQQFIFLVANGVEAIMIKILPAFSTIIVDSFLFLTLVILLLIVQPYMAVFTLLFIVFAGVINIYFYNRKSSKLGAIGSRLEVEINSKIKETLVIFDVAVLKNRVNHFVGKFAELKEFQAKIVSEIYLLPNFIRYTFELTIVFAILLITAFQFFFFDSIKAVTSITLFVAASTRIAPALLRIQQSYIQIKSNGALALETINLINETKLQYSSKDIKSDLFYSQSKFSPKIYVKDLSFGHRASNHNLIDGVSFTINEGETFVVIGESGVGKTTLINLVLGFLPKNISGDIRISDLSPREVYEKYPGAISYVPQKSSIIAGTIRENISLGYDPVNFSDEEFWRVLDLVELSGFVKSFDYGLDQSITEGGSNLSGGQKQKLTIARALFTNPKLLILDEPTSALDGGADDNILNNLKRIEPKITFLIITHRYSTMKLADRVLFMRKNGTINVGQLSLIESTESDYFKKVKH